METPYEQRAKELYPRNSNDKIFTPTVRQLQQNAFIKGCKYQKTRISELEKQLEEKHKERADTLMELYKVQVQANDLAEALEEIVKNCYENALSVTIANKALSNFRKNKEITKPTPPPTQIIKEGENPKKQRM